MFDMTLDATPRRESVADALMIVDSYGPWGADLNDAHRRQIVLADEVRRLCSQLQHWKTLAANAEGERSQMSADAARLDRFEDWLAGRAGPLLHIDDVRKALA